MRFNDDAKRLTYGVIATLIVHSVLFVLLGYADFSRATPVTPISIDLSQPSEELVERPDPEPEPAEEPAEPERELERDVEEEVNTELDPEPTEAVEEQGSNEAQPPAATGPDDTSPEPEVPREREPSADAFSDSLEPAEGVDRESLRRSRPVSPVPEPDGQFLAEEEARREAALEFVRRIDEQQEAINEELSQVDDTDPGSPGNDGENDEIVEIRSRITEITGTADDGASDGLEGESEGQRESEASDVGEGDDIEWGDGDARRRIVGDEIAFTSSDLRLERGTLYLQISFRVSEQGIVQPGSVDIEAGEAILTLEARNRLRETLQSWRFTASPDSPSVRGVLRLELRLR
ncbi:MAG: hypothetical protein ACLFNQ_04060 [Spirochaetaceae bacterium]